MYAFLSVEEKESEEQKNYAGVHNIKVKDISVYADEKVLSEQGTKCIRVNIVNSVKKAEFTNISIENISLNGKRVLSKEMDANDRMRQKQVNRLILRSLDIWQNR